MFRVHSMKRTVAVLLALLLCALTAGAQAEAAVGAEIAMDAITEFCYTVDVPLAVSLYLRYRFCAEDGKKLLYHESRQGDAWPLTEEDTVASGTVALTDEEWEALCDCLRGGTVKRRGDDVIDGDEGPWMYVYWTGDEGELQEFAFASREKQAEFEALCSRLAGNHVLTRLWFSRRSDLPSRSYEVLFRSDGCWIREDEEDLRPFDPELAEELRRVVSEYGLEAWDGFHGSDPDVLDGEGFSLELTYADGASVYASGDNAFPEGYFSAAGSLDAIFERERMSRIAGTYRYEGEGFGGDFTIALRADGTYSFYEGPLSSYQGGGTWYAYDNAVCMTEENGYDLELMFGVGDGALTYIQMGSDAFPHVKVSDGERFLRQGEAE